MAFIKETYNWVIEKVKQEPNTNQVLEPFSTLLKLAIISYKSDGTKIAVLKNSMFNVKIAKIRLN